MSFYHSTLKISCAIVISSTFLNLGMSGAFAEMPSFKSGDLSVTTTLELGSYFNDTNNARFGAGVSDYRDSTTHNKDTNWFEFSAKPGVNVEYKTSRGELYATGQLLLNHSTGRDAGGFSRQGDGGLSIEQSYFGWRSSDLIEEGKDTSIDLSVGSQNFDIGDGFLVFDGNTEITDDGTYWLGPRRAFQNSGIAKLDMGPISTQAFYLKSDKHSDSTQTLGANIDYKNEDYGTFGFTYLDVIDANERYNTNRDGRQTANARVMLTPFPDHKDIALNAEYVQQFGESGNTDIDANAYYINPSYTFSSVPWTPRFSYRYAQWSGDKLGTDSSEGYDPLFYGFSGFGNWLQGEIAGNFYLFNQNQVSQMVDVSVNPTDDSQINLMYFDHNLDEGHYYNTAVTDKNFMQEVNLVAQYTPNDWLYVGGVYGVAKANGGAEQALGIQGQSETQHMFEIFAVLTF